MLGSQEVHDIAIAIGVDPGSDDLSELRYGKICILADADSDGLHIATLLCALFVRHFRALVDNGHLFVTMPPLYRVDIGKDVFSFRMIMSFRPSSPSKKAVLHHKSHDLKGWGK